MKKVILSLSLFLSVSALAQVPEDMQKVLECSQEVQQAIIKRNIEELQAAAKNGEQERIREFLRQTQSLINAACKKLNVP